MTISVNYGAINITYILNVEKVCYFIFSATNLATAASDIDACHLMRVVSSRGCALLLIYKFFMFIKGDVCKLAEDPGRFSGIADVVVLNPPFGKAIISC